MKIDFRHLKVVTDLDGTEEVFDIAKDMANIICFKQPFLMDVEFDEFGRSIYKEGEVDVPEKFVSVMKKIVEAGTYPVCIKRALFNVLNSK